MINHAGRRLISNTTQRLLTVREVGGGGRRWLDTLVRSANVHFSNLVQSDSVVKIIARFKIIPRRKCFVAIRQSVRITCNIGTLFESRRLFDRCKKWKIICRLTDFWNASAVSWNWFHRRRVVCWSSTGKLRLVEIVSLNEYHRYLISITHIPFPVDRIAFWNRLKTDSWK